MSDDVIWPLLRRLSACAVMVLGGCSIAPGLYVDDLPIDKAAPSGGESLAGQLRVTPVTAELVRNLKDHQVASLQAKRRQADELFHQNQQLKESYAYRVGHTDVLNVISWGHPELSILSTPVQQGVIPRPAATIMLASQAPATSTAHEVDLEGNIFYPLIEFTDIDDKTAAEIRVQITEELSRYIPNPQIDVTISQFRSQRAYVVGEVAAPRTVPITQVPLEIIGLTSLAGGLTEQADTRNVTLIRDGERYHIDLQAILDGQLTQNYILRDKDVLVVPDNRYNSVFLLGEFDASMQVVIPQSRFFSLADAIYDSEVGGFSAEADPRQVFVFRYNEATDQPRDTLYPEAYHLNADSAEAMLLAANFPLLPRDIVYTAPAGISRWNRVIERLLPTIQAIYESVRTYWYIDDLND